MNNFYDNLLFFIALFTGLSVFIAGMIWTIYSLEKDDKVHKKVSKIFKKHKKAKI